MRIALRDPLTPFFGPSEWCLVHGASRVLTLPFFVTWSISRGTGVALFAAVLLHFMTRRGS
jgi:hypothetical protein